MAKKLSLAVGTARYDLLLDRADDGGWTITLDDTTHTVSLTPVIGTLYRLVVDGVPTDVVINRESGGLVLAVGADRHNVSIIRAGSPSGAGGMQVAEGEVAVMAPMAGFVSEVLVAPGDHVNAGDPLLVIVAMKMNNEIKAPASGSVKSVSVAPQSAVQLGDLLVVIDVTEGVTEG